ISGMPASEILDELIEAGLESLTGGGAEIFDWEVRQHIVDHATHWEDWSRIHRLAHEKGLKTPATMLYGHIEEPRHRVDHVLRLRELQDETGGFQVFIPLRYQH
ncbi:radical SAM protein, partial [Streptomyces sp. NRRL WC-3753]